MNTMNKRELTNAMMKVINQERLPIPERISIRQPRFGIRKTAGKCIYRHIAGSSVGSTVKDKTYRIIISTTIARFVPDPNGTWTNKDTGQKLSQVIGGEMPKEQILDTAAHEIAHLRYFHHGVEHTQYTQKILRELITIIRWTL